MATESITDLLRKTGGTICSTKLNQTSGALQAVKDYKTLPNFLKVFNPSLQDKYCRHEELSIMGKCPSLVNIDNAFGEGSAETWLKIQIADLNEFCGGAEKLNIDQIRECASAIRTCYPNLKATELMIVFKRFKAGKAGRIYGSLNPVNLNCYIDDWTKHRMNVIAEYEMIKAQEKAMEYKANAMPAEDIEPFLTMLKAGVIKDYSEYLTLKQNKDNDRDRS